MNERREKPLPEPTYVDEDGVWFLKEHKEYVMTNQKYWEEQHKEFKVDEEAPLLSDQYAY
jgi:hypothetical protein